jgi:hypothetical protein
LTAALDLESGIRAMREAIPAAIAEKLSKPSLGHTLEPVWKWSVLLSSIRVWRGASDTRAT